MPASSSLVSATVNNCRHLLTLVNKCRQYSTSDKRHKGVNRAFAAVQVQRCHYHSQARRGINGRYRSTEWPRQGRWGGAESTKASTSVCCGGTLHNTVALVSMSGRTMHHLTTFFPIHCSQSRNLLTRQTATWQSHNPSTISPVSLSMGNTNPLWTAILDFWWITDHEGMQ